MEEKEEEEAEKQEPEPEVHLPENHYKPDLVRQ